VPPARSRRAARAAAGAGAAAAAVTGAQAGGAAGGVPGATGKAGARTGSSVLAEVIGWFRPASLAELHRGLTTPPAAGAAAARAEAAADAGRPFDLRPAWVLLAAAVLLIAMEYGGYSSNFRHWFPTASNDAHWGALYGMLWWAGVRVAGFVVFPMIAVALLFDEPLAAFGLRLRGAGRHLPVYAVLFGLVAPLVLAFSFTEGFRATYPFYRLAGRSALDFVLWEHAYIWQFFGVEFFFRGFLLHGTKRRLGAYSVAVSVVPYVMIHFGKPLPEVCGAVVAGTVLGVLSLRTGSIWAGFLIHVSVAVSMDVLSLLHGLPPAATTFAWL
jgi:membrane protease YdiL (CAAX protease family)